MNIRVDLCHNPHLPFKRMKIASRALCAAFALLGILGVASPAPAATLLVNADGQLIGATGVDVFGTFYDVAFVDGTCAALFSGCDAPTDDFTFTDSSYAHSASLALLEQVFVGIYDTAPILTWGCINQWECDVYTPYGLNPPDAAIRPGFVKMIAANNDYAAGDSLYFTERAVEFDSADNQRQGDYVVYADWTVSSVPEPSSMVLFGTALLVGVRRWRQKRA